MKFGVSTFLWTSPLTTEKLAELVPHVADLGFDLIELPVEDPALVDYARVRELLDEHELDVSLCAVMSENRDLIHPDPEIRATGMDYVRTCIDIAQEVGAEYVVGPLYAAVGRCWRSTPEQRQKETELLVEQLSVLSEYAGERDVLLLLEALNRFETSFLNLTSQVLEVVEQVDHPSCQVLVDTFHLGHEEKDMGEAIRAAGPRIRHVHVSENDRGIPGTGLLPWDDVAEALQDIDYDGAIVIESFTADNDVIARAASIWRPLAPDQDTFAREGLQFLQELFS